MSRGRRIGKILLGLIILLGLAVWTASIVLRPKFPTPSAIVARMQKQAALTGGAQVYATHCAYCHDTGFGPSLAGRSLSVAVVGAMVRSGPGSMQAFTPAQVSNEDIETVTRYVDSRSPGLGKGR